jgi:hypothetical protein
LKYDTERMWQQVNIEIWDWNDVAMAAGKYRNIALEGCGIGCR